MRAGTVVCRLLLAFVFSGLCAAKNLSLYRVDGDQGNVNLHHASQPSASNIESASAEDSSKISYVRAAVSEPGRDSMYRSEEAKLQQERRLMFFRNLQMGSMSMSTLPEPPVEPPAPAPTSGMAPVEPGMAPVDSSSFASYTDQTFSSLTTALTEEMQLFEEGAEEGADESPPPPVLTPDTLTDLIDQAASHANAEDATDLDVNELMDNAADYAAKAGQTRGGLRQGKGKSGRHGRHHRHHDQP